MAVVTGSGAAVQPVGGRGVHRDGGDRRQTVKVRLSVPIAVAQGRSGDVAPVRLDKLQSGNVVVLLYGSLTASVLCLAQDERSFGLTAPGRRSVPSWQKLGLPAQSIHLAVGPSP